MQRVHSPPQSEDDDEVPRMVGSDAFIPAFLNPTKWRITDEQTRRTKRMKKTTRTRRMKHDEETAADDEEDEADDEDAEDEASED